MTIEKQAQYKKLNLYVLLLALNFVCLIFQFEPLQPLTIWVRAKIEQGQWWRIISSNFTHTNMPHLAINLAALWLIGLIFTPRAKQLLILSLLLSLIVGICLFVTEIEIYAGLSGVLHGLFAFFALQEVLNKSLFSLVLVLGFASKIAFEQLVGVSVNTETLINAKVAIEAHLAGGLSGFALAIMTKTIDKRSTVPIKRVNL